MANGLSCKTFGEFLIRRSEHLDSKVYTDITPTDGWIAHVATGVFEAFDGTSHTFDRLRRVYPDLSGCWRPVVHGNCLGTPCDPPRKKIGMGFDRDSYQLQEQAFATDVFCLDAITTADRAEAQFAYFVENLRNTTNIVISDRLKNEAWRGAGTIVAAANPPVNITVEENDTCTEIVPSELPSCMVTIQMLQRFIQPLMLDGALGEGPDKMPMFEYVTDQETAWRLREGNAELQAMYRFTDFTKGGDLYKYGVTDAIGNFMIRVDRFPTRYQLLADGVTLQKLFPYTNVTAFVGIKGQKNQQWMDAYYQWDFIWNRNAMKSLLRQSGKVNPNMPFGNQNYGGDWKFVMHDLGEDENGCVYDNSDENKGRFQAKFSFATLWARPEWVVAILTLRSRSCITCITPCSEDPGYVEQDYNSANEPCANPTIEIDVVALGDGETYSISADDESITCNGVPVVHDASGALADIDAVVVWLNANVGSLGTFSAVGNASPILLDGSTCNTVSITIVAS